jgi:MFS family permease
MQTVALGWLVYRLTGSALLLGVLAFLSQLPVLILGPIAGVQADRHNRRHILLATQSTALIVSLVMAGLIVAGHLEMWHLYALSALQGCANAFDFPARQVFVAEIAGKRLLPTAIPLNSSITNAARAVGPALAGILIVTGGEAWCFFANALSYLLVVVALLAIRSEPGSAKSASTSAFENIKDGFGFLWSMGSARASLFLLALVSLMGIRYDVLMPVFASQILHGGPGSYGILMAMSGAGAIGGSLILALSKSFKTGLGRWIGLSTASLGAALILFSVSRSLWLSAGLLIAAGFSMVGQLDATNVLIQKMSPDNLRGRVMALWTMALTGLAPFGSLLTGWLGEHFGAPRAVAAGGAACVMGAIVFGFCLPTLRFQSGTRFDVK